MKVKPMQRIKVFSRIVLHPEKAHDAQTKLELRQIFGLP